MLYFATVNLHHMKRQSISKAMIIKKYVVYIKTASFVPKLYLCTKLTIAFGTKTRSLHWGCIFAPKLSLCIKSRIWNLGPNLDLFHPTVSLHQTYPLLYLQMMAFPWINKTPAVAWIIRASLSIQTLTIEPFMAASYYYNATGKLRGWWTKKKEKK